MWYDNVLLPKNSIFEIVMCRLRIAWWVYNPLGIFWRAKILLTLDSILFEFLDMF